MSASEPRPETGKKSGPYATRFAHKMAVYVANGFRSRFPEIKPDASVQGVESRSRAVRGLKRLDVNFSTQQAGLLLGISLKSVHFSENATYRFHHNCKRNDEELRVEATGYHQRQPYSVLVAIVVLPIESCDDADARRPSSFGTWVQYLWPLAGRSEPHDDPAGGEEEVPPTSQSASQKVERRFFSGGGVPDGSADCSAMFPQIRFSQLGTAPRRALGDC